MATAILTTKREGKAKDENSANTKENDISPKTNEENSLEVLKEVLPLLEEQYDFSNDALFALLKKYVDEKGVKTGFVMWPIRTAVSGKQMTPGGATELMEVLGKEESIARIKKGIELLSDLS